MAARNNPASEFWLNECKVVPNQNLIVCGTEEVSINPRSMAVLLALVERQGEYLGAQALFDQVWPANHISDNSVYKAINELRTAFGDIAEDPQFIETKSRRGYRLITAPKQSARNRRMLRNPWIYAALGLGVIAIAGFNGFDTLSIESNEPADVSKSCPVDEDSGINLCTDPSPTSIAVLQLVSPGNDSQENLYA